MAYEFGRDCYIDPTLSYEDNDRHGPFGAFKDTKPYPETDPITKKFLGRHPVRLDLGIGAGTLPNSRFVKGALDSGWDVAFYKTVRLDEYECAPHPNVTAVDLIGDLSSEQAQAGIQAIKGWQGRREVNASNSYMVPSKDSDEWVPDAAEAVRYAENYPGGGKLVVVSFQGTTGKGDFFYNIEEAGRKVRDTGTKVAEENTSCPNEGTSHLLCFDMDASEQSAIAARKGLGPDIDLIMKIAYFLDDDQLREFVRRVGPHINAINAINTIPGRVKNEAGEQFFPGKGREISGFSGDGIRHFGMDMVRRLTRHIQDLRMDHLMVIASGGVTTPIDYVDYKNAGADGGVLSVVGSLANPYLASDTKATADFHQRYR